MFPLLNWLAVMFGSLLIGLSIFLYEDEERRLTSWLQDFWVTVDDLRRASISRPFAFLQAIAVRLTSVFDTLVGTRPFSARSLALWIYCYQFAYGTLQLLARDRSEQTVAGLLSAVASIVIAPLLCFRHQLFHLGALRSTDVPIALGVLSATHVLPRILGQVDLTDIPFAIAYHLADCILTYALPLAVGWFSFTLGRSLLRRFAHSPAPGPLVSLIGLGAVVALVTWWSPDLVLGRPPATDPDSWDFTAYVRAYLAMFYANAPLLFMLLSGAALATCALVYLPLRRLLWPLVARPIYGLARANVFKHRLRLASVGCALLVAGGGAVGKRIQAVVEVLLGLS